MMESEIHFTEEKIYDIDNKPFYIGQFSELYKAIDRKLKRTVIIKAMSDITNINILERELMVCCKLGEVTSHVPIIIDYKRNKDSAFIVMQWIPGLDLSEYMRPDLSDRKRMKYMRELCAVLSILHKNNYEHRDLKPSNIRIGSDDRVYLLDFNITALEKHRGDGSEYYRAPENDINYSIKGNGSMDVFSIGVIMYQMFTNHLPMPFVDYVGDYSDKEWSIFKAPVEYYPKLNTRINDIIVKCMKMNPRDRYQNAGHIYSELIRIKV